MFHLSDMTSAKLTDDLLRLRYWNAIEIPLKIGHERARHSKYDQNPMILPNFFNFITGIEN